MTVATLNAILTLSISARLEIVRMLYLGFGIEALGRPSGVFFWERA